MVRLAGEGMTMPLLCAAELSGFRPLIGGMSLFQLIIDADPRFQIRSPPCLNRSPTS